VQSELAGLNQVRHDRLNTASKKAKKFVNQSTLGRMTRNDGFKDVGITDLLDPAQNFLVLHAIYRGLHSRISRPFVLWESFLNFSNGRRNVVPQSFHNFQFKLS